MGKNSKNWFFEKNNKINNPLQATYEQIREDTSQNVRNERGYISIQILWTLKGE